MNSREVAVEWIAEPRDRRAPWTVHINTSANGGGVAELIRAVIFSSNGGRNDLGWAVVRGGPQFYSFTKNVHHLLHGRGAPSDLLTAGADRDVYRETLALALADIVAMVRPGDVVVLHDPQTLGLAPWLALHGIRVMWHCHVGSRSDPSGAKSLVWRYFSADLQAVERVVVTHGEYLKDAPVGVVEEARPAIWADSPKNAPMTADQVNTRLAELGLYESGPVETEISRVWQAHSLPSSALVVLQVGRWDPLKGITAVLRCSEHFGRNVHLVLAGPDPREVVDDPEGRAELDEVLRVFHALPIDVRARTHIVAMAMVGNDRDSNEYRVNALQRRADIVVQKSIEEGFGLAVTEAMYKSKPIVASRIGGLDGQVIHGVNGFLVGIDDDDEFIASVVRLCEDRPLRLEFGRRGRQRVTENYLIGRLVSDYDNMMHGGRR